MSRGGLEENAELKADRPRAACLAKLQRTLTSPTLDAMVAGFNDLTHPEMRLKDWMKETHDLLKGRKVGAAHMQPRGWGG